MDSNSHCMSFCSILHFPEATCTFAVTSCGWQPERQQMDALGNVNPTPTTIHSAAFSLPHSVPPNSQEKFSQSPFPLSGYFAVGRRSRPLLARAALLPRARSFSQCIPLCFERGPCFSWEQDQTDPQRCGRRTEYFAPLKRSRAHLSRKRMAREEREERERDHCPWRC